MIEMILMALEHNAGFVSATLIGIVGAVIVLKYLKDDDDDNDDDSHGIHMTTGSKRQV